MVKRLTFLILVVLAVALALLMTPSRAPAAPLAVRATMTEAPTATSFVFPPTVTPGLDSHLDPGWWSHYLWFPVVYG